MFRKRWRRSRLLGLALLTIAGSLQADLSQSQTITTAAGNGTYDFSGDGGTATSASLRGPFGVTVDAVGNLYVADGENYRIRKVTQQGVISTFAGNGSSVSTFGLARPCSLAMHYSSCIDDENWPPEQFPSDFPH